jgi:mono/diheme cytochrome c family protein
MKKLIVFITVSALVSNLFLYCAQQETKEQPMVSDSSLSPDSLVKRGQYLVTIMGCNDCHSPKLMGPNGPYPDPEKLLSGHPADMPLAKYDTATAKNWLLFNPMITAMIGPWGVSYTANITSDSTGIGNWTEQQFFKAIREGKYKGLDNTRPLLPPMPWQEFAHCTDEDLKAIFAYLKSTKPVRNVVPAAVVNPPPPGK